MLIENSNLCKKYRNVEKILGIEEKHLENEKNISNADYRENKIFVSEYFCTKHLYN